LSLGGQLSDEYNPYQPPRSDLTLGSPTARPGPTRGYGIPFTVGDVIGATFRLWAQALGPLLVINLLPVLVGVLGGIALGVTSEIGEGGFDFEQPGSQLSPGLMIGGGLLFLIVLLVLALPALAGSYLILHDEARGLQRRGALQAFGEGFHFFWSIFGSSLLIGLAVIAVFLPVVLGAVIHLGVAILLGLGSLCAATYLGIRWAVVAQAITLEDCGAVDGLTRSSDLVTGRWWPVFGISLLFGLISFGVELVSSGFGLIPGLGVVFELAISVFAAALGSSFGFCLYAGLVHDEGFR